MNKTIGGGLAGLAVLMLLGAALPAEGAEGYAVAVENGDSRSDDTPYLGVELEEEIEHPEGGARLAAVIEESPADRAGLREGDVIVGFAEGHRRRSLLTVAVPLGEGLGETLNVVARRVDVAASWERTVKQQGSAEHEHGRGQQDRHGDDGARDAFPLLHP